MEIRWDPGESLGGGLRAYLRLIRLEHTLFSLPFAYAGGALAVGRLPAAREVLWMTLAVFGLRSAAMAYNNLADLDIDSANPRTRGRPLVTGAVTRRGAWVVVALGSIVYYLSSAALNLYAAELSPILWALAMSYPHSKRIHPLPHLHLGLVLGAVVMGGAIGCSGDEVSNLWEAMSSVPWGYLAAVTLWVAGFDVFYSIMDMDFDRSIGLKSLPALLGVNGARTASSLMHAASSTLLLASPRLYGLGSAALAAGLLAAAVMAAEQALVWRDLDEIPRAFNLNLGLGWVISLGILLDVAWW